jgi:hypothetical protein
VLLFFQKQFQLLLADEAQVNENLSNLSKSHLCFALRYMKRTIATGRTSAFKPGNTAILFLRSLHSPLCFFLVLQQAFLHPGDLKP